MRCPVCRAENDQGPQCRRCRADLSLLFALEAQRDHYLALARQYATRGQWDHAFAVAEGVDTLRRGADARRLLAVSALLRRDFSRAWQYYHDRDHPDR